MRRAAVAALALLVLLLVLLGAAPAGAESAAQVRDLARRAHDDPGALAQLKAVRDIDGRPVDMNVALGDAAGPDLDRRLDALASGASADLPVAGVGTNGPRQSVRRILESRRFQPPDPPRPLRGAIRRLGGWLAPVTRPAGRLLRPVWRAINDAFSHTVTAIPLGIALVVAVALVARALVRRRARLGVERARRLDADLRGLDPADLERQADAAEAGGQLDHAFRLRFLAGLLRLDQAGALAYRPSLTTGELVRSVPSATFPRMASAFDAIAYGGRQPGPADMAQAKADWPRILDEARR
jgi:hypothetical protein